MNGRRRSLSSKSRSPARPLPSTLRFRRRSATKARPTTCGLPPAHGEPGLEIFVYGVTGGAFPARQHIEASKAIARLHRLDPARTLFAEQSEAAIAAGAFHNDVVAVANERVLFAHELAFADKQTLIDACSAKVPGFEYVEVAGRRRAARRCDCALICSTRSW